MNRFFRTAYATALVYLCLTLFAVLVTKINMPFLAFSCLYFGLMLCLLPAASSWWSGKRPLFAGIGIGMAVLGFLPLFLLHCPLIHWLIHLLGIVSAAAFLVLLRHRTTHSDYLAKYQFIAVLLLILMGFVFLSLLAGIYQNDTPSTQSKILELVIRNIVPYAIVVLVSGVLLLRGLRAQEGVVDERAFNRRQLRDTLIFAVLVTLIFSVDPFVNLKRFALFLFTDVLRPSALFLVQLLDSLLRLISRKKPEMTEPLPTPEATSVPGEVPTTELSETSPEHYHIDDGDLSLTLAYIFLVAAAVILLLILVRQTCKLIRRLKKHNQDRGNGYPNETRESLPREDGANGKRRRRRRSENTRERMRYLYGELLRYLRKHRVRYNKEDTCGEIQRSVNKYMIVDSTTVSDFTELYEQARYRLKESPTEADAHRMKTLLDRIKRNG